MKALKGLRWCIAVTVAVLVVAVPATAMAVAFSGEVFDENEAPISGVEVRVYEVAGGVINTSPVATATTGVDGSYDIVNVTAPSIIVGFADPTGQHRDGMWDPVWFSGRHLLDSVWAWNSAAFDTQTNIDHFMPSAAAFKGARTYRVWGDDRYENAIAVSEANFPYATDIVLVSGASFADALSAAPWAGLQGAPILLTPPSGVPSGLIAEIKRLGTAAGQPNPKIWIVGGTASVSTNVVNQLKAAGLTSISRFSGADRYAVAATVAKQVQAASPNKEPFLVRGDVFADALSVSPFAYMENRPILLTKPSGLPSATRSAWASMRSAAGDTIIAVGGPASITDTVLMQMDQISGGGLLLPDGDSIYGADRYSTGAAVISFYQNDFWALTGGFDKPRLASGEVFPDALAGGAAAGYWFSPLVLTRGASLSSPARSTLAASGPYVIDLQGLGGPRTLGSSTLSAANTALGTRWYDLDGGTPTIPAALGGLPVEAAQGRVASGGSGAAGVRPSAPFEMRPLSEADVVGPLAR